MDKWAEFITHFPKARPCRGQVPKQRDTADQAWVQHQTPTSPPCVSPPQSASSSSSVLRTEHHKRLLSMRSWLPSAPQTGLTKTGARVLVYHHCRRTPRDSPDRRKVYCHPREVETSEAWMLCIPWSGMEFTDKDLQAKRPLNAPPGLQDPVVRPTFRLAVEGSAATANEMTDAITFGRGRAAALKDSEQELHRQIPACASSRRRGHSFLKKC